LLGKKGYVVDVVVVVVVEIYMIISTGFTQKQII